uniref:protein FAM161B isoform X2 n=1 Tax=Scatophagus argus TaxID=75038 RepID=UPI001ED86089|nr:protein FAM161B isoform X2 [Scatophagus argus]
MSKLETLLQDGLRSELVLQQHLKALSEALGQQLQETEKRQREELEKRIHQNALLSKNQEYNDPSRNHQTKPVGMRRSTSASVLTSDKEILNHPRQSKGSNSLSAAWKTPTKVNNCSVMTSMLTLTKTQKCERFASSKTTQMSKEEEAEAECQKKFCAIPVPSCVTQPLYQEMMELREKERKQCHEQRREFLLSIQKPFSFLERENEKREKLIAMLNQVSRDQKRKAAIVRRSSHKEVKDSSDSEVKDQELCRQVNPQTSAQHDNPTVSGSPKLRTAERTRKEKLQFLYERPSFHPKIIHQVPDFNKLHKALQTEALRKTQSNEVIKCQPFHLRTSALPARKSRMSPQNSQVPKISNLSRSKSLGTLTSLSTDTLPIYITDAVRKRCMAIRKSIEMRDSKNQESSDWLKKYQMSSQAMKKTVSLHAKLLDPHSSLKELTSQQPHTPAAAAPTIIFSYMKGG